MTEETVRLVAELRGDQCRCGMGKPSGRTFCLTCYRQLPPALRRSLYRLLDEGYIEAYAAAVEYLEDLKRLGV